MKDNGTQERDPRRATSSTEHDTDHDRMKDDSCLEEPNLETSLSVVKILEAIKTMCMSV